MILLIDNYDSFTYNLVQRLGEIDPGIDLKVVRNDQIRCEEIESLAPSHLIISPGPCTPCEAGISMEVAKHFAGKIPILGVCLGHQSIGQAFGAKIVRAPRLMHGKTDMMYHDGQALFAGLPNPFQATRYHSLIIQPDTLSDEFEITAWCPLNSDGAAVTASGEPPRGDIEIMGIRHKQFPLYGLQFHPESFLTPQGIEILKKFITIDLPAMA